MKNITLTFIALLIATFTFAQAPQMVNYQGVARNLSGNPLGNQNISLRLSILSGSPVGTSEYVETHNITTNNLGLFSIQIGNGMVQSGSFSTIDWGGDSHYLQTELDENGGTAYVLTGTSPMVSVPYALHANTASIADSIVGGFTDTQLDSTGITALGFVAGAHTVDTDTQLDSAGIAALGFVAAEVPSFLIASPNNDVAMASFQGTIEMDNTVVSGGTNITRSGSLLTLKAGHLYRCSATLHVTLNGSNEWTRFQLYDNTSTSWLGVPGTLVTDNRTLNEGQAPRALAYIDLTSTTTDHIIRLRHKDNVTYTTVWGANQQTYCECYQLD
jgi:hypothetical protein